MDDILIVGAGIGGLTLGLALHAAKIPCRIFESAAEIRPIGVGINLLPHATKELAALGLEAELAKVAIATFTASLAQEVLDDGVMVNAIAPSTIDTEANRVAMPKAKHENWVKPADIARTIAYLCSDDCRVTSGAVIPVYGRA